MTILVYAGEGVGNYSLRQLTHCLKEIPHFAHNLIISIDDHYLKEVQWQENCKLLVFPGGRDIPYKRRLQGIANQKIRDYVSSGGIYLGICAGGYYGATEIEFEKGFPLEICEKRELGFFPGKAVGPAYGPNQFRYDNENGARNASLSWSQQKSYSVYFNGGCFFAKASVYPEVTVLATFADLPNQPAAVISCKVGKGTAILSGVHPEYPLVNEQAWDSSFWNDLLDFIRTKI